MITNTTLTMRNVCRPIKKKSGVIAGIAHAGGGRDSSVGYGPMDENEEVRNIPHMVAGRYPFFYWLH